MKAIYFSIMVVFSFMFGLIWYQASFNAPIRPARHVYRGQTVRIVGGKYKGCDGIVEERISYMWVTVKTQCQGLYQSVVVRLDQLK
jgi:hypothetical protein